MASLDEGVIQSVINTNFKVIAEAGVLNAQAHANRLNLLAEKSLARSLENQDAMSVGEGLGTAAAQRGDLSKVLTELGSAISGIQQLMKGAQTTPPPTTGV